MSELFCVTCTALYSLGNQFGISSVSAWYYRHIQGDIN